MQGQTNPFPKPNETIFGATTYRKRTKKEKKIELKQGKKVGKKHRSQTGREPQSPVNP